MFNFRIKRLGVSYGYLEEIHLEVTNEYGTYTSEELGEITKYSDMEITFIESGTISPFFLARDANFSGKQGFIT